MHSGRDAAVQEYDTRSHMHTLCLQVNWCMGSVCIQLCSQLLLITSALAIWQHCSSSHLRLTRNHVANIAVVPVRSAW